MQKEYDYYSELKVSIAFFLRDNGLTCLLKIVSVRMFKVILKMS